MHTTLSIHFQCPNWLGGALIRCIDWFGQLITIPNEPPRNGDTHQSVSSAVYGRDTKTAERRSASPAQDSFHTWLRTCRLDQHSTRKVGMRRPIPRRLS